MLLERVRKIKTALMSVSVVVGIAIFSLISTSVSAAERPDVEITMTPTNTRVSLRPGTSQSGEFTVVNSGKKDFKFTVYANPYQVSSEAYDPVFSKDTAQTQIARWVTFEKNEYSLKSGAKVVVPYKISVPKDIPDGGQYAVFFAETTGEEGQAAATAIVSKKRVGMLVYGRGNSTTRNEGNLLSTQVAFWYKNSPIVASTRVQNTGNTDFIAQTTLSSQSVFGSSRQKDVSTEHVVLPGTVRSIKTELGVDKIGLYKVSVQTKFLDKKVSSSHMVVVAPLWVIIIVICGVGGILWGSVYGIRKIIRARKTK